MGEQHGERKPKSPPAKPKLVFVDPLDRQTSDDTDRGWGERADSGRGLDWYLSERPPHHGE